MYVCVFSLLVFIYGIQVSSVIASVEDTLGLPSPEELAQGEEKEGKVDEETKRLAEGET